MKKFLTILGLAMVANTGVIYAQYAGDALRFSQTNYGSSARFKGLGNAQTSLGGDISSIGGNPAGLGMFTRSEFSITPEFNNTGSKSNYFGQNSNSTKNSFNLNQAGIVWYNPVIRPKGSNLDQGIVSFVWGIGYNRNNDFSQRVSFAGKNPNNSLGDYFAEQANNTGQTHQNLPVGLGQLGYDNFLINETSPGVYQKANSNLNNNQYYNQTRWGSTSEFNFAGSMNISNQVYIGASIGFVTMHYDYDSNFSEMGSLTSTPHELPADPKVGDTYTASYLQSQTTRGNGINGRIGIIYKPINEFRIGASFQTPTWMHVEDTYSEAVNTLYNPGNSLYRPDQNNYVFQYTLRTPMKTSVGASLIIAGNGLLTGDVDFVNYSSIKLSTTTDYNTIDDRSVLNNNNQDVKDFYKSAVNFRVGGEYKIDPITLRAGFGLNGTPYKQDPDNQAQVKYYSAGLGYRINQYYVDLAYQRVETNQTFVPYTVGTNASLDPTATTKLSKNNVFLTFGVRF